jgi:hypothetical protein
MVDGAYDLINEKLRPGVCENDIVAEVNKFLYTHGSDDVEAINAISGERCNPHPHNFTDRMIRPGDQAFFDILQSFMGYRTCYYRTFNVGRATAAQRDAYKMAREWWTTLWPGLSRAPPPPISAAHFRLLNNSAFPMRCRHSASSLRTDLALRCTSGQSFLASFRWTIPQKSKREWSLRSKRIARQPTDIPQRGLKRKWSSRIEDAASSLCFQQRPFQSLTPTDPKKS